MKMVAGARRATGRACRNWVLSFLAFLSLYPVVVFFAARWHDHRYPPTITNSISLDAKLQFLRRNRQLMAARSVVAGSSMALNNIDGDYLWRTLPSEGPFVDLAAWGLQIEETGALLDFFLEHAPQVGRVILVGQVVDFVKKPVAPPFDREELWSYVRGGEPFWFGMRHFDTVKAFNNWRSFDKVNLSRSGYEGLCFDSCGSVMLDVPPQRRNPARWNYYGMGAAATPAALSELERILGGLRKRGIRCTFVVPPVRRAYREHPESCRGYREFKSRAREIAARNGARFVDADQELRLDDDCFIDMMHLNRRGARRVAELLAPLL